MRNRAVTYALDERVDENATSGAAIGGESGVYVDGIAADRAACSLTQLIDCCFLEA